MSCADDQGHARFATSRHGLLHVREVSEAVATGALNRAGACPVLSGGAEKPEDHHLGEAWSKSDAQLTSAVFPNSTRTQD